ncbi:phosphate ABC transporter substrate-binding protein, PhoT family [Desulforamulus reducens MI-1]|uniref:Phosphate ABC transporter substrate-binding protein, PhoT family n=1 Tax=Desulforamulus reducens (strain ATCC BAA-1160 / DSM 100696 / MI-1) TaxID=349161 RepID=A4J6V2_DESRM|nr:phosphate ABC transporter substrate-binding protein [Desulforamulus reducens]ABO50805.1 phosphate ABC transporter substrate-binding protein, PhoT family [Desulforamulus reducens MI-1]
MRKSKLFQVLLGLMVLLMLAGCGQSEPAKSEPARQESTAQSIKIGGSSTLAPVIAKCADDFTEEYKTWNKVDPKLPEEPIVIFVSTGGSGFGVKSAIDGTVDIGLVSREVKDTEKGKMPNGKIIKMGSDALTIAVNPKNPVIQVKPDLTNDEVKRIFAGEIKTWQELDAKLPARPVVLAIRDLGGGASQVFDELVMKKTPIAKEALQLPSMGALAGKVAENADAIGYVSFGLVKQNQGKISVLSVDGVTPTTESIASGQYKIARPLLLVTKEQPNERQQLFIDYLLSKKGLKVVEDMGFIPPAK